MDLEQIRSLYKDKLKIDLDKDREQMDDIGEEGWVDSVLWQTAYVCHDYFISEELFGYRDTKEEKKEGTKNKGKTENGEEADNKEETENNGENLENEEKKETCKTREYNAQQLVYWNNYDIGFWIRKIILDNAIFDIYINLGRKVNANKKIDKIYDYFAKWEHSGYYVLSEILRDKRELNYALYDEIASSSENETGCDQGTYNSNVKNAKTISVWNKPWFAKLEKKLPEKVKECLSKESKAMFDAMLLNCLIHRGTVLLKNIWLMQRKDKKWSSVKNIVEQINQLQFEYYGIDQNKGKLIDVVANSGEKYKNYRLKRIKDQQIFDYEIELFLHGRLQIAITDLCVLLYEQYDLRMKAIEKKLIETVKMGLRFGMEFLLYMPLTYIDSPAITERLNDREDLERLMYVHDEGAIFIWTSCYGEYLSQLTYLTIPIVRTALEYNLRMAIKKISDNSSDEILFDHVEQYVMENIDKWKEQYAASSDLLNKKNIRDIMGILTKRAKEDEKGWYYLKNDDIKKYIQRSKDMYMNKSGNKSIDNKKNYIPTDYKEGLRKDFLQKIYDKWYMPEHFGWYRMQKIDQEYFSFISSQRIQGFEQKTIAEIKKEIITYYGESWEYEQKRY